jgi:hypothetical protein
MEPHHPVKTTDAGVCPETNKMPNNKRFVPLVSIPLFNLDVPSVAAG